MKSSPGSSWRLWLATFLHHLLQQLVRLLVLQLGPHQLPHLGGPPMTGMLVVSLWVMSGGKKMQKRKVCGGDGSKEKAGQGSETKLFLGIS